MQDLLLKRHVLLVNSVVQDYSMILSLEIAMIQYTVMTTSLETCVSCCNGTLCNTVKIDGATCSAMITGQVFSITLVSLVLGYLLAG